MKLALEMFGLFGNECIDKIMNHTISPCELLVL